MIFVLNYFKTQKTMYNSVTILLIISLIVAIFVMIMTYIKYFKSGTGGGGGGGKKPDPIPEIPIGPATPRPKVTQYSFTKDSYAYKDFDKPISGDMTIEFDIKSTDKDGVIMTAGQPGPARTGCLGTIFQPCNPYMYIYVIEPGITFTYVTTDGIVNVYSRDVSVTDGQWHNVKITREGNIWKLIVDTVVKNTQTQALNGSIPPGRMYFGYSPFPILLVVPKFEGCIKNIKINNELQEYLIPSGNVGTTCT